MNGAQEAPSPLSIKAEAARPVFDVPRETAGQPRPPVFTPRQQVFSLWTQANGMRPPFFIPREQWEKQQQQPQKPGEKPDQHFLFDIGQGDHQLILPEDLQPWEVIPLLKDLDNTLPPEQRKNRSVETLRLGTLLRNSGVLLATRMDGAFPDDMQTADLQRARQIAQTMAEEFYQYGSSVVDGQESPAKKLADIVAENAQNHLPRGQEIAAGRFLLGENTYQRRVEKAAQQGKSPQQAEEQTIRQFFRTVAVAERLSHQQSSKEGRNSVHESFLEKIQQSTQEAANKPSSELTLALLDHGMQYIRDNLGSSAVAIAAIRQLNSGIQIEREEANDPTVITELERSRQEWENAKETLREAIGINQMKEELRIARQGGDKLLVAKLEKQFLDRIQRSIAYLPYNRGVHLPHDIVATESSQCIGSSLIGSAFLSELSIPHLTITLPAHSSFLVITEDRQVQWRDMGKSPRFQTTLTEGDLLSMGDHKITLDDLIALAENPDNPSLTFSIPPTVYKRALNRNTPQPVTITTSSPGKGLSSQLLSQEASLLNEQGNLEQSLAMFQAATQVDPYIPLSYFNLSIVQRKLGNLEDALDASTRATRLNPNYADAYHSQALIFQMLGKSQEALNAYRHCLTLLTDQDVEQRNEVDAAIRKLEQQ